MEGGRELGAQRVGHGPLGGARRRLHERGAALRRAQPAPAAVVAAASTGNAVAQSAVAASASAGERKLWRETFSNGYIPENQKFDSNVHDLPRNQIMRVAQRFPTTIKLPDPDRLPWDDGGGCRPHL